MKQSLSIATGDGPPLRNMPETVKSIIAANPDLAFCYYHFVVSTRELAEILDGISFTHSTVIDWLKNYLETNIANLYGGAV